MNTQHQLILENAIAAAGCIHDTSCIRDAVEQIVSMASIEAANDATEQAKKIVHEELQAAKSDLTMAMTIHRNHGVSEERQRIATYIRDQAAPKAGSYMSSSLVNLLCELAHSIETGAYQ